jgi:hypothetical protein
MPLWPLRGRFEKPSKLLHIRIHFSYFVRFWSTTNVKKKNFTSVNFTKMELHTFRVLTAICIPLE